MKDKTYLEKHLGHRARMDLCLEQAEKTGERGWLDLAQEELKASNSWRDKLYRKWELRGRKVPSTPTSFEEEWTA